MHYSCENVLDILGKALILFGKVFVMEVFWKLVKGELRQQLMYYAEDFNVDLMHQGDQNTNQNTTKFTSCDKEQIKNC